MSEHASERRSDVSLGGVPLVVIRRKAIRFVLYLFVIVASLSFSIPYLWGLFTALKTPAEIYTFPPTFFPRDSAPQWRNFVDIWKYVPFDVWVRNSVFVTLMSMIGQISTALIVAYGFSRFRFPGRNWLFGVCLATMMLPVQVTIVPLFLMFRKIGWVDSLKPLIVPSYFGGGAFIIFLLRQFIMNIPLDMDESALIDGASRFTILVRIVAPLCKPALTTAAIFSFRSHWDAFLMPLIFINSKDRMTLPIGLRYFVELPSTSGETLVHFLMAASITVSLPIIIIFFFAQRYFIQGIVMEGIKG